MDWVRTPAVAGLFYPDDPSALRRQVEGFLREARESFPPARLPVESLPRPFRAPKGLIAPHAGYVYSGPVAASGYRCLDPVRERIRKVVLLGPAHRLPIRGLAATTAAAFLTPLGTVPVDRGGVERALALGQVQPLDEAHEGEHSLEVHLPFLQVILGEFSLVPLVVGEASPGEVAEVLEGLWGGEESFVVVSSDLSHYLPYRRAVELDRATAEAIESCRLEAVGPHQACGWIPVAGLLQRARDLGLVVARVDLRNSGDTAGPRHQVVGYGSFLVG